MELVLVLVLVVIVALLDDLALFSFVSSTVDPLGFEPRTFTLQRCCSTVGAIGPMTYWTRTLSRWFSFRALPSLHRPRVGGTDLGPAMRMSDITRRVCRIRTYDLSLPKRTRCQTAPIPVNLTHLRRASGFVYCQARSSNRLQSTRL